MKLRPGTNITVVNCNKANIFLTMHDKAQNSS